MACCFPGARRCRFLRSAGVTGVLAGRPGLPGDAAVCAPDKPDTGNTPRQSTRRCPPKETSPVYQALKPFVNPVTGELQLPQALPAGGGFNREKLVKMFRSIGKPYIEGAL